MIASRSGNSPAPFATPESLAYVLYTSGSTGKPKGVEIPHSALTNFLLSMQREPGFTSRDVLLALTTLSFDIAGLELYLPLISGGTVVIASRDETRDPVLLMRRMQDCQCTIMQATPPTWRALVQGGWSGSPNLKILCGGEPLPRDLANELLPRCATLWNMYGPTETTIWSTIHRVTEASGVIPIGRPIANTQVFVLDSNLNPLPTGSVGELYIGGAGLAQGYLGLTDLTEERFIRNPFAPENRLYRTGDLVKWLPDRTLECLGRADSQIKIRGFRIELGEIESVLGQHPAVEQCVAIVREDTPGDKRLVAHFTLRFGSTPTSAELLSHLKKQLPDYMLPAAFIRLENIPLTPNGKIDRKALPAPTQEVHEVRHAFVPPKDALEQMLCQIWSSVLKLKRIGLNNNFFDLGGYSLLALRIIVEIEKRLKIRLPLATLLQAPTIGNLAEVIRREQWSPAWHSLVPIKPDGLRPPLFLLHSHGGNVLEYYPLASHLDCDQPVYALQAGGVNGAILKDRSIEEMVAAYLEEMRHFQPEGPYYLGGFCFGGLLALEAAHQLTRAGEQVPLVVMIQTIHPAYDRFSSATGVFQQWWYRTSKRLNLERENLRYRGAGYVHERSRRLLEIVQIKTQMALDKATGNGHIPEAGAATPYILETLAMEHARALEKYTPPAYGGDVVLLRANKQMRGFVTDSSLGWRDTLTGNFEVREVPGHQQNLLSEPHVSYLAREIAERLQLSMAVV